MNINFKEMAMKRCCLLLLLPFVFCSCLTRIVTTSPSVSQSGIYTTSVTVPRSRTMTTTAKFIMDDDLSLCLDLQAVAAAFAQSSDVEEFEQLLNSSTYMLSNLDLNGDGYVDYLRVIEDVDRHVHVFTIQSVLGAGVYQDVATMVVEYNGVANTYVQLIGSSYIYGHNFIIQPVFVQTPRIYVHFGRRVYVPWRSPWDWGRFPSFYRRPVPVLIGHYQAYVNTYMHNSRYCHHVTYADVCHYPDYMRISAPHQRDDYGRQHPERSFAQRTANIPSTGARQAQPRNARDIIERQAASSHTVTTARTAPVPESGRVAASASSSSNQSGTSVNSRVSASGGGSGVSASGTSSASSRAAASQNTSSAGSQSAPAVTQRTSSSQGAGRPASSAVTSPAKPAEGSRTTVSSRVSASGTSETRTSTVSPSGQTTVSRRGSGTPAGSQVQSSRVSSSSQSGSSSRSAAGASSVSRSAQPSPARSAAEGGSSRSASTSSSRTAASSGNR